MKHIFTLSIAFFYLQLSAFAQPEGDIFPDFTVEDIEGNSHHLQDYLDDDKTVLIDVFATWCIVCINSLPAVDEIYELHGPDGDNTVVVLSFEHDANTSNEAAYVTTHNVPNPVISDGLAEVATWNTVYQPNFFVICADGSFTYHFSGVGAGSTVLSDLVAGCSTTVTDVEERGEEFSLAYYTNPVLNNLEFEVNVSQKIDYNILDLSGKTILRGHSENAKNNIDVSSLESGIYFLQLVGDHQNVVTKKFIKQ